MHAAVVEVRAVAGASAIPEAKRRPSAKANPSGAFAAEEGVESHKNTVDPVSGRVHWTFRSGRAPYSASVSSSSSFIRCCIWAFRRARMDECIWLTRDSERASVAPISFMVMAS